MANSYYFHRQTWSIDATPPGRPVGTLTALLISCVLGFFFVIFLPVIGFVLAVQALAMKIFHTSIPLVPPSAVPGEAHLTGHPEAHEETIAAEELDKFLKEVQELRAKR